VGEGPDGHLYSHQYIADYKRYPDISVLCLMERAGEARIPQRPKSRKPLASKGLRGKSRKVAK
jgi:hypothetical protein